MRDKVKSVLRKFPELCYHFLQNICSITNNSVSKSINKIDKTVVAPKRSQASPKINPLPEISPDFFCIGTVSETLKANDTADQTFTSQNSNVPCQYN